MCIRDRDNIERAIKRGCGETSDGQNLEEIMIEAYGPGNSAIIVEAITENKNRTMAEIKQALFSHNAKLVGEGGVKWMFKREINQNNNCPEWIPKQTVEVTEKDKESCKKLFASLEEIDSVQEIYTNLRP